MRRSCAPSIIQNGDPKKSRRGPSTRGGGARAGAEAAEAAHAAAKPALAPAAAAAAAQASLAAKKPYKCPLPGAQTGGGTLGMRRTYAATAGDLLRQMTKLVVLGADGADLDAEAAAAAAAELLLLYDPLQYGDRVAPPPAPPPAPPQVADVVTTQQQEENEEEAQKGGADGPAAAGSDASKSSGDTSKKGSSSGSSGGSSATSDDDDGDTPAKPKEEEAPAPAKPKQEQQQQQQQQSQQHPLLGRKPIFADAWLSRRLRPHQREGVRFVFECLSGLRQPGMAGCVLADGMGLGKTFQACCSVWFLLQNSVFHGPGVPTSARPIILCPTSLVRNWGNELDKWLEGRVEAIVVDDSRAPAVKEALANFAGPTGRTTAAAMLAAKLAAGKEASAAAAAALAAAAAEQDESGAAPKGPPPPPPPPVRMPGKPKVLVLSYTTFRMHFNEVARLKPDLVVCDEAHALKNSEAQITSAVAALHPTTPRLLLSGTPVQNDLSEFYSVFSLAVPGLLGDARDFSRRFERPILRGRDADADERDVRKGLEAMAGLSELCHRFMLRRTSAVLKKLLPPRVEQVVFCRPSRLQLALFQAFLEAPAVKALVGRGAAAAAAAAAAGKAGDPDGGDDDNDENDENAMAMEEEECGGGGGGSTGNKGGKGGGKGKGGRTQSTSPAMGGGGGQQQQRLAPLVAIGMLKKLCCHPDLIYECVASEGGGGGGGRFGAGALSNKEPPRRSGRAGAAAPVSYAEPSVRGGGNGNGNNANANDGPQLTGFEGSLRLFSAADVWPPYRPGGGQPQHSGKLLVLEALLRGARLSSPTDKFVLVSNHTTNLDVMGALCASRGWRTLRLDGSSSAKSRQATVDRFNAESPESSFALLLSSRAGGTGLNIIGANRLVLFDGDWNPGNDLQAMARVWREGQKKACFVYRMVTAGTIEEKIYQRQLSKTALADTLVDREEERRTFSRSELRSMFAVAPEAACETHGAVRCGCDGSRAAAQAKRERAEAAVAAAGGAGAGRGGGGGGAGEDNEEAGEGGEKCSPPPPAPADAAGVAAWAHLSSARDLGDVDPAWRAAAQGVVDAYVSFVFSDHAVNDAWWRHERVERRRAEGGGGGGGSGSGDDEEGEEDDEEEAPRQQQQQQASARRKKAAGSGSDEHGGGDDGDEDYAYDGACGADDDE